MNNQRRKEINTQIKFIEQIEAAVSAILDEEQESYDNIPENLQESERAQTSEEAIECLLEVQ